MKKATKPKLSREERAALKAQKREEKAAARAQKRAEKQAESERVLTPRERQLLEKKQARRVAILARLALGFLFYVGMMLLVVAFVFVGIWTTKRYENTVVTSMISVEESRGEKLRVIHENNVPYISISFLSNYGELIHAGDYSARTIRFTDSGDTAIFSINSAFCSINGVDVNLGHPVLLRQGELYLPLEFFNIYVTGITLLQSGNRFEISPSTLSLGYKIKPAASTIKVPEEAAGALLEFSTQKPTFLADLEAYERYMNPGETTEFLTLVNLQNGISETFRPNDLTGVEDRNAAYPGGDYHARLRMAAAKSLDAMIAEASANGFDGLQATSGYRSYAEQRYRFNTLVTSLMNNSGLTEAQAEEEAVKSVQKPGYSEYQTGLCADLRYPNDPIDTFKDTEAAKWLEDNCYKFGFILRYPEHKTESTGMEYQSWHFRYVGRYHAIRIKYLDMSLEEYYTFMGLDEAP